jgi:hypothetical protein
MLRSSRRKIKPMSTNPSHCRFVLAERFGSRRPCLAAVALLLAMLSAGTARSQDWVRGERQAARTSALHNIAMIQASNGDVQGAKETVRQMVDGPQPGSSEVTVVWFCNGQPIYDHPPKSAGSNVVAWEGFLNHDRAADPVPVVVPPGLPANYLAADPRHGAVVEFSDEYDSRGTRVTSRKYADGSVVIETPHSAGR